jgi:hypothetical protein
LSGEEPCKEILWLQSIKIRARFREAGLHGIRAVGGQLSQPRRCLRAWREARAGDRARKAGKCSCVFDEQEEREIVVDRFDILGCQDVDRPSEL